MADCGVGNEATLFLVLRLRGGAKKSAPQPQIACPLAGSGCTTTHAKSQLQRWVDHANSHRTDSDDGGAQWAGLVAAACRDAGLDVGACTCGLIFPNTKHGRKKHACAPAIAVDSKDAAPGDAHAAAHSDALAAIITTFTQVLGVTPALPTAGKRGRPRADDSILARPRPPDPPPKPPVAPARAPGLHVDFDGGARGNPGVGGSGSLLLCGGVYSVLGRGLPRQ